MEELVASYASRLLSDKSVTLSEAYAALKEVHDVNSDPPGKSTFPRLVQELAVHRQGFLISKLLKQVLDHYRHPIKLKLPDSADGTVSFTVVDEQEASVVQWYYVLFILFSGSQTVVDFCLKDEGVDQALLSRFMEHLPSPRPSRPFKVSFSSVPLPFALFSLDGVLQFARASKRFRQLMRDTEGLLPALQSLFEEESIKRIGNDSVFSSVRIDVSNLLLTLTIAKDSRTWTIDKGFLALLASICGTAKYDTVEKPATGYCALVLRRLCEHPNLLCRKLRKARELFLTLKPYSSMLDAQNPGVWRMFLEILSRKERAVRSSNAGAPLTRMRTTVTAGLFGVPSVCSWEGCSTETDLAILTDAESWRRMTKLSKCGRCAMAFYCSKDHQKLHWQTHKRDCFEEKRT